MFVDSSGISKRRVRKLRNLESPGQWRLYIDPSSHAEGSALVYLHIPHLPHVFHSLPDARCGLEGLARLAGLDQPLVMVGVQSGQFFFQGGRDLE